MTLFASSFIEKEKKLTLKAKAITQLRNAIISGKFAPGTRLIEVELSKMMGISRLPIREAIGSLEQAGLVTILPYQGAFVNSFSQKEVNELFMIRELLEVHALRLLMDKKDYSLALTRLRNIIQAMEDHDGNTNAMNIADFEFHAIICECADNSVLYEIWRQLSAKTQTLFSFVEKEASVEDILNRHKALYELIKDGNFEIAADNLRKHLQAGKGFVMQRLKIQQEQAKD